MVKIRLQGRKKELRRMLKFLSRAKILTIDEKSLSNFNKSSKEGYYYMFVNIYFNPK